MPDRRPGEVSRGEDEAGAHRAISLIQIACGISVAALGLLVTIEWLTMPALVLRTGSAPMTFNGALGFLLVGLGLVSLALHRRMPALVGCAYAALVGTATLVQHVFDLDLGIDQLFVTVDPEYLVKGQTWFGREAPNAATSFVLFGGALLVGSSGAGWRRGPAITGVLASVSMAIGAVGGFGYVGTLEAAYTWGSDAAMPLHTALGIMVASAGLVAMAWNQEWLRTQRRPRWWALPVGVGVWALTLFLSLGLFSLGSAHKANLVDTKTAEISILVIGAMMSALLATALKLTEDAHTRADTLRVSENQTRLIIQESQAAYVSIDEGGAVVEWNRQAGAIFGWLKEEVEGRPLHEMIIPKRDRERHLTGLRRYVETGKSRVLQTTFEMQALHRDGHEFPIDLRIWPVRQNGHLRFHAFINDITEPRQRALDLERQTRALSQSNAELEQFAYIASHDLQEPLRTVSSYVQLLARRYEGKLDDQADQFIAYAVDGVQRMQALILDLLDYSRLETKEVDLKTVDCGVAVQEALDNLRVSVDETDATVSHNHLPSLLADGHQLTQLFQNLIGNAIKFRSAEAPHVNIEARREDHQWVMSVQDNGIGIEPQHAERVFDMFQRLHTRDEFPGTGVGLAICKKIVEGHGGRIWAHPQPQQGTTFHFTMPEREVP